MPNKWFCNRCPKKAENADMHNRKLITNKKNIDDPRQPDLDWLFTSPVRAPWFHPQCPLLLHLHISVFFAVKPSVPRFFLFWTSLFPLLSHPSLDMVAQNKFLLLYWLLLFLTHFHQTPVSHSFSWAPHYYKIYIKITIRRL